MQNINIRNAQNSFPAKQNSVTFIKYNFLNKIWITFFLQNQRFYNNILLILYKFIFWDLDENNL